MHRRKIIPTKNIKNFRDMGGYKTKCGKNIKYGVFYRSGQLSSITKDEIKIIKDLGIKTIFDYRSDIEFSHSPTPEIEGIQLKRVSAINITGKTGFGSLDEMLNKAINDELNIDLLINLYKSLPFNNPSYQKLVSLIEDKENLSILHHCAAGKDRTGVGGAIILMILGCSRETIIEDYLLSNELLAEDIDNILAPIIPKVTMKQLDLIKSMVGVRIEFIEESLNAIEKKYKTYDNYLLQEFNLTSLKLDKIRALYLE